MGDFRRLFDVVQDQNRADTIIEGAHVFSENGDGTVNILHRGVPLMSMPMQNPKLGHVKIAVSPNGDKVILS